jgi:hypothetical protein
VRIVEERLLSDDWYVLASALVVDAARNLKAVQTAFVKGIEIYLNIIAAQIDGDRQEARQQAIALLSGLVGAMMLSRAVTALDRLWEANSGRRWYGTQGIEAVLRDPR